MSETIVKEIQPVTNCYHCGEDCTEDVLQYDNHSFCCGGCQTVYKLLSTNGLSNYYQLEEKAKPQLKKNQAEEKFASLDDTDIQQRFITFADEQRSHTQFYLPKIHCTSCLWLLEKLPWLHEGIIEAKVNYLKKELFIIFDHHQISLRELATFLNQLGYPPHISHKQENDKKTFSNKETLYKLGVTGFCAGNIMLMSFPEYLGYQDIAPMWKNIFGWLSLFLSLPIVFWSASQYWQSAWQAIKNKGMNIDVPISIGLTALFSRSLYEIISQTGAGYFDSLSSLIFFLLIGKWIQERTYAHISFDRDYKSYFPIAITKIIKQVDQVSGKTLEKEVHVPIEKLQKGDEILVRNGELIPADAVLTAGHAQIDLSFITGEAIPVHKKIGDLIYAGGKQKGGMLRLILTKEVSQSYLTQLWNSDTFQKSNSKQSKSLTDQLSAKFTLIVLLIATFAGLYWLFFDSSKSLDAFTAVLIVACPCALALNAPFTLGNALRILAMKGFFIKNTQVLEQIPTINHLVFDKTGTITDGSNMRFIGTELTEDETLAVSAVSNSSAHPISKRIYTLLGKHPSNIQVEDIHEEAGAGIEGWVGDLFIKIGKASYVEITQEFTTSEKLSQSYLTINGELKGRFVWKQSIRNGVREAIQELGNNYQLSLLSGDKASGQDEIVSLFPKSTTFSFAQQPIDKMNYLAQLQEHKQSTAMIGDGLNDAGALKQANVGIAISDDIHHFSPASDAILMGDKLKYLPKSLHFIASSIRVVKLGYLFSFLYNIIGITFAIQGLLAPVVAAILMSLSSVSVVIFGYVLTNLLSKKLGY